MNIQQAKDEFSARFYLWAKEDIKREVREGFPFLRMLETGCAFRFLSYVQKLSDGDCINLMTARLKRQMTEAAESFGEPYSNPDMDLVEGFSKSPLWEGPLAAELFERQLAGEKHLFADRKILRALIKEELKPIFGEKIKKSGKATWTYLTPVEGWTLQTDIDTGGRSQLRYGHTIGSPFHPFLYENPISVLSWLGTGGRAQWDFLTPQDVPEAVKSLRLYCSHFMAAVPKLLSGIGPI